MSKRQRSGRSAPASALEIQGTPLDDSDLGGGRFHAQLDEEGQLGRRESRHMHPNHCSSCDNTLDKFEKSNHRQLQGRCSGCHQLFTEGKYCPVCIKVWTAEDENMVGCDTCQFWVHSHCDQVAKNALTKAGQMDYFCPQCRKVRNVNNRLAAIKQAHDDLMATPQPLPARSAFQLFAHELEKQCRANPRRTDPRAMINHTWRNLTQQERQPYERVAANDQARFHKEKRAFMEVERRYSELQFAALQDGILDESGRPIKPAKLLSLSPTAGPSRPGGAGPRGGSREGPVSQSLSAETAKPTRGRSTGSVGPRSTGAPNAKARLSAAREPPARASAPAAKAGAGKKRTKAHREDSPDYVPHANKKRREMEPLRLVSKVPDISPPASARAETSDAKAEGSSSEAPPELEVFCNDVHGTLFLRRQKVACRCKECATQAEGFREFSCTQFEQHGGSGTAKKWKASLKIVPGSTPDVPAGAPPMSVGKWMEKVGMELKPGSHRASAPFSQPLVVTTRAKDLQAPARRQTSPATSSLSLPLSAPPPPRPPKKEEKDHSSMFEPWLEIPNGRFRPMKVRWAGERCSVCDSDVDFDFDQLVSCDQCGITVHQTCYGVSELPGEDDLWLCRVCEHMKEGDERPQCCLCPVTGGALKQTTEPGVWCHSACMQWIPEVTVEDLNRMEPISHINSIQKERWDLNCSICKQKAGAKIQCSKCYTAYHPLCGRIAGLMMEMQEPEGPNDPLKLVSLCHKHCTPKPHMTGVTLISQEEEARQRRQGEGNGLWNAQLFPPPALVPVPDCPNGSARVEKLQSQDWVRKSHGRSNGYSSITGFWIPKQQMTSLFASRGKIAKVHKRRSTVSSLPRGRTSTASRPKATKPAREEGLVQAQAHEVSAVDLIQLPEGVPEEVGVQCNGRSGMLQIRTQRVVYGEQELSASRFESICGKGEAKKWKCSLWLESDSGEPIMMMQEWLESKKLDRKALASLSANYSAAESYLEYCAFEVNNVLNDMLEEVTQGSTEMTQQGDTPAQQADKVSGAPEEAANAVEKEGDGEVGAQLMQEQAQTMTQLPLVDTEKIKAQEIKANKVDVPSASIPEGHQESCLSSRTNMDVQHDTDDSKEQQKPAEILHKEGEPQGATPKLGFSDLHGAHDESAKAATDAPASEQGPDKIANGGAKAMDERPPSTATPDALAKEAPAITPPQVPQGSGPASVLGQICEIHFEQDKEWYQAIVRGYDKASKLHNLWYFYDEEAEWIDLVEEDRSGRVRWQNPKLSANLRESGESKRKKPPPPIGRDARQGDPTPTGESAVDWRISVWWKDDAVFYQGTIQSFNPESGRHKVKYDDGEVEHLMLTAEHIRWDQRPASWEPSRAAQNTSPAPEDPSHAPGGNDAARPSPEGALDGQAPGQGLNPRDESAGGLPPTGGPPTRRSLASRDESAAPLAAPSPPLPAPIVEDNPEERAQRAANAPDSVPVICNMTTAVYITHRGLVQMSNGQVVSPTEFERMSGKAASKKWKASIRIDKGGGSPGITIGDWLIDQGLEAPKAPRIRSEGGVSHQQRRTLALRSLTTSPGSGSRAQGHRESCMCVICKQSRRTGKAWSGMDADKSQLGGQAVRAQPSRQAVPSGARFGKRAFIRCTGQFIRGPCNKQTWELPQSKIYTAEQWEALHRNKPEVVAKKEEALSDIKVDPSGDVVMQEAQDTVADSSPKDADASPKDADSAAVLVKDEEELAGASGGPVRAEHSERRALTLKERLEVCQATERQRLAFCKSGIHGWGLIARVEMKQDSMIIEYRGETLRRAMADEREKEYRVKDMDCYLFNINDDVVVDATMKGTIGRFTNHCCSPSMYTKVVEVDSKPHVVFFARQDIRIGQELTYDYRFKEEEGDNKMICQCGAPNCRGTMN